VHDVSYSWKINRPILTAAAEYKSGSRRASRPKKNLAQIWVQLGSKTAQTPGNTGVWQIPESKTSQQDGLSRLIENPRYESGFELQTNAARWSLDGASQFVARHRPDIHLCTLHRISERSICDSVAYEVAAQRQHD